MSLDWNIQEKKYNAQRKVSISANFVFTCLYTLEEQNYSCN